MQRQVAHFAGGHSDHHPIPRTCCYWHISDTGWHLRERAPNPHTGRARVRDGDVEMRETIDRALESPRRKRARGDGASASELKPDFTHCLVYNCSLTDLILGTDTAAGSFGLGRTTLEDAKAILKRSVARPKFSSTVRAPVRAPNRGSQPPPAVPVGPRLPKAPEWLPRWTAV